MRMQRLVGPLVIAAVASSLLLGRGARAQSTSASADAGTGTDAPPAQQSLGIDTSIRGGYWSHDRNLDDNTGFSTGSVWLRAQPKLSQHWDAKLEGWLQAESSDAGGNGKQELREAYAAYQNGDNDLRIGRQIVVWGRADQINPTDNISSRDFTLMFPEVDDLRRGNGMVRASRAFDAYTVSALWLPEFRPNVFPTGALPTDVHFGTDENPQQYDQSAFKLDHTGGDLDWSISYFDGLDRTMDIGIESAGPSGVTLQRQYNRIQTLGGDFAFNLGRFGLRGEAAYTETADPNGTNPYIKNPFFFAVLGGDRSFFEYLNINVQVLYRETTSFHDPHSIANPLVRSVAIQNATVAGQLTPTQTGMSTRIGYKWFHETLEAEIAAAGYFEKGDSFVRTKILYHFTDTLRGTLAQETYQGPTESFYGLQKKNSTTYAEMAYGF